MQIVCSAVVNITYEISIIMKKIFNILSISLAAHQVAGNAYVNNDSRYASTFTVRPIEVEGKDIS